MSTSKPRTLHFAVGGALLAIGTFGAPVPTGCDLDDPAQDAAAFQNASGDSASLSRETQPPKPTPIVVNPGPITPEFPLKAETSGPPIIINPGPVPSPPRP